MGAAGTRDGAATQRDAIRAGRRRFLRGEKFDMRSVAEDVGIGRATIFRWFGDRDRFVSEIMFSLFATTFEAELARPAEPGGAHIVDALVRTLKIISEHPQFNAFLARDPQRAMVILTGRDSALAIGAREWITELIKAQCPRAAGAELPAEDLAYSMLRLAEAYTYADIIAGRPVDVARLRPLFHRLLEGS